MYWQKSLIFDWGIDNPSVTAYAVTPPLTQGGLLVRQLTKGIVKVNSVLPSRLVTLMFSPWLHTMVFTM